MTSKEQRFEHVKNEIAESEKPKRHSKETNVEAAIGEIKTEFSSFEEEKQSTFFDDASHQKTSNKI
jgi:hypothetical protein